jgi:hypothetical protein
MTAGARYRTEAGIFAAQTIMHVVLAERSRRGDNRRTVRNETMGVPPRARCPAGCRLAGSGAGTGYGPSVYDGYDND